MKTFQQKDEIRHGRARSDGQMRDAMKTASIPNSYLTKAMQQSIRGLEQNGFLLRRIMPVDPMAGIHSREFRADFAKQTKTGLLVFSVRIDTDGNVTNLQPNNIVNRMTSTQAREWMISHWDADEIGTDLDLDTLADAHLAILGRFPSDEEDAFGNLKSHLLPTLTAEESAELENVTNP